MSENWAGIAVEVSQGLFEAGTTGYLVRKGAKSGPDYNPTFGPDTETPVTVVYSTWKAGEVDGTLIKATDQKILVEAGKIVPDVSDMFSRQAGGRRMSIINIREVSPAGIPVLYILQCRE